MAARAALWPYSDFAHQKIKVIINNQKIFRLNFIGIEE